MKKTMCKLRATRSGLKRQAFTLIEIMVVVIILAILAGILTPNLQGALEGSRLETTAMRVSELMDFCYHSAIASGRVHGLIFNSDGVHFQVVAEPAPPEDRPQRGKTSSLPTEQTDASDNSPKRIMTANHPTGQTISIHGETDKEEKPGLRPIRPPGISREPMADGVRLVAVELKRFRRRDSAKTNESRIPQWIEVTDMSQAREQSLNRPTRRNNNGRKDEPDRLERMRQGRERVRKVEERIREQEERAKHRADLAKHQAQNKTDAESPVTEDAEDEDFRLLFFPDGSTEFATLTFANRNLDLVCVELNGITGAVRVFSPAVRKEAKKVR
jgi:prepilin-type N-terminal cleavage/methylation domain-containing protein